MAKFNKKEFKWSDDKGVWHNATIDRPPSVMICGNRMVQVGAGFDCYGFYWSGSTLAHWHCCVNMSFDEALSWVKGEGEESWWTPESLS